MCIINIFGAQIATKTLMKSQILLTSSLSFLISFNNAAYLQINATRKHKTQINQLKWLQIPPSKSHNQKQTNREIKGKAKES